MITNILAKIVSNRSVVMLMAAVFGAVPAVTLATDSLEEVIVTAQRREQTLQDVAASVTALSSDDIARLGIREGRDIFERLANVSLQTTQSEAQPLITMRGIGYQSVQPSAVQPVGLFQDDVALNSPQLGGMFMFDLQRIEVVRGPQNTLYGRNTTGGAINFVTRKPVVGEEMQGNFAATYGRFNQIDFGAGVSAPLGEQAALRVAVNSQDSDGTRHNIYDDRDVEQGGKKQARVQLAWNATDTMSTLFNVHLGELDSTSRVTKHINLLDPANPDPTTLDLEHGLTGNCPFADKGVLGSDCVNAYGFTDSGNLREVNSDMIDPIDSVKNWGASMNLVWDLSTMSVTSITAYENVEYRNIRDDSLPKADFIAARNQDADQISQEIRFASPQEQRLRWVAGAYYFEEDSVTDILISVPYLMMGAGGGMFSSSQQTDTSLSGFGEIEWDVNEKLTATVGFRYSSDTKKGTALAGLTTNTQNIPQFQLGADGSVPVLLEDILAVAVVLADDIPYNQNWKDWGGKLGLSYQHTDDLLLYASISRGIKAGGFPTGPNIILADLNGDSGQPGDGLFNNPVDPETVTAYEVGLKGQWLDDTFRTNLALFYNDYQDQQVQTFVLFDQPEGPPQAEGRLINIGSSYTSGAELETIWLPTQIDGLTLTASVGYLTTKIQKDVTGRNLVGNELNNAPNWTTAVTAVKEWNVDLFGNGGLFALQLDGRYTGSRYFDLNNHPLTQDDGYTVLNAAAHFEFGPELQYRLSLWGKNINGAEWFNTMEEVGNGYVDVLPNTPPTYGLTFNMHF